MECKGVITALTSEENGFIIGEDGREYVFHISDILDNKEYKAGSKVVFKPNVILNPKMEIFYATSIDVVCL